jgi:hypothetical protein
LLPSFPEGHLADEAYGQTETLNHERNRYEPSPQYGVLKCRCLSGRRHLLRFVELCLQAEWHVEAFASRHGTKHDAMKIKTVFLSVSVFAAALSACMAQSTFSVNAVGYVNVPVIRGYQIIGNPLINSNNTLNVILPSVEDNTKIYRFSPFTQTYMAPSTFFFDPDINAGAWSPDVALFPGEGVVLFSPTAGTLTFIGEVAQGSLTNRLYPNFSILSSIVPQAGEITSVLRFVPCDNDSIYFFNPATQTYGAPFSFFFDPDINQGAWSPRDPVLAVGQGFVFRNTCGVRVWTRTFSVN